MRQIAGKLRVLMVVTLTIPFAIGADGCGSLFAPNPANAKTFCSNVGMYYCNTNQNMAGDPLPNGWPGYCMAGNGNAITGYSGTTSNGGATPIYPSVSAARQACAGVCNAIVRCEKDI